MKLIPFEKVRNALKCFIKYEESLNEQMDSFTTIDPIQIIDEEIQMAQSSIDDYTWDEWNYEWEYDRRVARLDFLQELKSRLLNNK